MPDKSWKAVERRMAKDVGVQRIAVTGERHGADFEDGIACYQVKCRKAIPGWLWDWLSGIQGTGKGKGKAGVLVLKTPHQRDEDALVVLSWKSWVELHGTPKQQSEIAITSFDNAKRGDWVIAHLAHGMVTKGDTFDSCSCGGTFWH